MQKNISTDVHLGNIVTPFESIEQSSLIDKTASDFDNAKTKVSKI